eukprot:CAMPEP_0198547878 /NCGR_PEP_ID=MMETSP1462-20131121/68387_1 /TAXON_ID=1333877 /ORGANISM="Brandtodinium nutriculum, Strain RCC3387" /LENGTH=59 /DNA_ID=CAMNT_0044278379 /DNA_START=33 /DNA_END=208 /DNA_ORIENTATION=+
MSAMAAIRAARAASLPKAAASVEATVIVPCTSTKVVVVVLVVLVTVAVVLVAVTVVRVV